MAYNFFNSTQQEKNMLNLYRELLDQVPQARAYPLWNARRCEHGYVLEVAATGFDKTDLSVTLDRGVLRVVGTGPTTDHDYLVHQITHKSFVRTWNIPEGMTVDLVKLENGVLIIHIVGTPVTTVKTFEVA